MWLFLISSKIFFSRSHSKYQNLYRVLYHCDKVKKNSINSNSIFCQIHLLNSHHWRNRVLCLAAGITAKADQPNPASWVHTASYLTLFSPHLNTSTTRIHQQLSYRINQYSQKQYSQTKQKKKPRHFDVLFMCSFSSALRSLLDVQLVLAG